MVVESDESSCSPRSRSYPEIPTAIGHRQNPLSPSSFSPQRAQILGNFGGVASARWAICCPTLQIVPQPFGKLAPADEIAMWSLIKRGRTKPIAREVSLQCSGPPVTESTASTKKRGKYLNVTYIAFGPTSPVHRLTELRTGSQVGIDRANCSTQQVCDMNKTNHPLGVPGR